MTNTNGGLFSGPRIVAHNQMAIESGILPIKVTPFYRRKIVEEEATLGHANGPLARTALPIADRFNIRAPLEVDDFVDDRANMPGEGVDAIVQKYSERLLFFPTDNCAGHCTYCFRTDVLSDQHGRELPSLAEKIDHLLQYLAKHPEVSEVIFSGGDPMTLPSRQLRHLLHELRRNTNIVNYRIHTRTLAFFPKIFDEDRVAILAEYGVRLVHHIVHPYELCIEAREKIELMRKKGIRNYNQFPILRKVNDHPEVLIQLLTVLDELNIRNLSMFIPDPIKYSAVFRIRLERLLKIVNAVNWSTSSWINSTRTVLDTRYGKVRLEDLTSYDRERNVATFEREGRIIEYFDFPAALDEPGDINTMLWRRQHVCTN